MGKKRKKARVPVLKRKPPKKGSIKSGRVNSVDRDVVEISCGHCGALLFAVARKPAARKIETV